MAYSYYKLNYPDGRVTDGHTDPALQWDNFRLPRRVEGRRVYDYGTWDGGLAIEATKRGALEVWGLDSFVWEMWTDTRKAFEDNIAALAPQVKSAYVETEPVPRRRYNEQTVINPNKMTIQQFAAKHGRADMVIAAGVFYHLMNPYKFVEDLILLVEPKGELYLTTFCHESKEPIMRFEYGWRGDDTNYWLASAPCVVRMLEVVGFEVIDHYRVSTEQHREPLVMFVARPAAKWDT